MEEEIVSQHAIRNTSSYDDILLQKTKAIICQVLDNLNQHQEIQDVQVLSGRETIERWDNDTSIIPSQGSSQVEKRVWPVTFEQFVEHLDGQDRFVKNLAELLVSVSRKEVIMNLDSGRKILRLLTLTIGNGPKGYSEISRRLCPY